METEDEGGEEDEWEDDEEECSADPTPKQRGERELSSLLLTAHKRLAAMKRGLGWVMRSEGCAWLSTKPGSSGAWTHAGSLLHLDCTQDWFASVPEVRSA